MEEAQILELLGNEETREKGFRQLMDVHQERLYWHIRRMVKSHEDTNDVLQNTFIKVFRNIESFKGQSSLFTWMYRIATNESLNHLKKRERMYNMSDGAEDLAAVRNMRSESWTDGDAIRSKLDKAIAQLPEKQKMVFELRYFQEIPYAELSDMLGTSVGGLKALFHHAVKKVEKFVLEATV